MQSTKTNLIPITFFRKLLEGVIQQNESKNQEKEMMQKTDLIRNDYLKYTKS